MVYQTKTGFLYRTDVLLFVDHIYIIYLHVYIH